MPKVKCNTFTFFRSFQSEGASGPASLLCTTYRHTHTKNKQTTKKTVITKPIKQRKFKHIYNHRNKTQDTHHENKEQKIRKEESKCHKTQNDHTHLRYLRYTQRQQKNRRKTWQHATHNNTSAIQNKHTYTQQNSYATKTTGLKHSATRETTPTELYYQYQVENTSIRSNSVNKPR